MLKCLKPIISGSSSIEKLNKLIRDNIKFMIKQRFQMRGPI